MVILSFCDALKKKRTQQKVQALAFEQHLKGFLEPRGFAVRESRAQSSHSIAQAATYLIDAVATAYVTLSGEHCRLGESQISILAEATCHLCQDLARQTGVAQLWYAAASQTLSTMLPLYTRRPVNLVAVTHYLNTFKEGPKLSPWTVKELARLAQLAICEDDDNYVAVLIELLLKPIYAAA